MNGRFFRNQQPSRSIRSFPAPKVISVPVHFISSQQSPSTSKASAALKIQTLFRGFLVRKSVKKIASIGDEVSEIERRIDDIEVADLIRRDAKERLRVNETLMSLLFKLDSIRGFDFGVRELRKAVTRKAIGLQEKVDSIALDSPFNKDSAKIEPTSTSEQITETSEDECNPIEASDDHGTEEGAPVTDLNEDRKEDHHTRVSMEVGDGEKGSRELIVKLMADNEKMMKLMMQISERNEMQTRMINSLSRRVEQLEKAFMTQNLKRKKKTRVASRNS